MENETVLEQELTQVEEEKPTKMFTQDEVNKFVTERLAKERKKYSDYDALKEKATQFDNLGDVHAQLKEANEKAQTLQAQIDNMNKANEVRTLKESISKETGVPINLLVGDNEESLRAQAKNILDFAKPLTYPQVKDGGEVAPLNHVTKESILSIKNEKERIKAIQEHIELFK